MADRKQIMSWLEGLAQDDWPMFHSDSEVQEIAKVAFELVKAQAERIGVLERTIAQMPKPVKLLDVFGDNYEKIVRCNNCKYKECEGRDGFIVCDITGESHKHDWFCADGEEKDG